MSSLNIIILIATLIFSSCSLANNASSDSLTLLKQYQDLPDGFSEHFFNAPLTVRITIDNQLLGEGEIVLGLDSSVQLLKLIDISESDINEREQQFWITQLNQKHALGLCQKTCQGDILAIEYNLENSQLAILTAKIEKQESNSHYYALPEQGSYGALFRQQLNWSQSNESTHAGRYNLQAQASLGQWTTLLEGEVTQNNEETLNSSIQQLYAEQQNEGYFYRFGYFSPYAQGLVRQPIIYSGSSQTVMGVMLGHSNQLLIDQAYASATPIYVTPNRSGMVEIYRNGQLINSQQIAAGLQAIDTKVLPSGIYEVEIRILEDGQITERRREIINKPIQWQNTEEPFRVNLFAGEQLQDLTRWDGESRDGLSTGVLANYLLTPAVILGAAAQFMDQSWHYSVSADWDWNQQLRFFGNWVMSEQQGSEFDLQAVYSYNRGSFVISHQQQLSQSQSRDGTSSNPQKSSVSLQHNLGGGHSVSAYLSHQSEQGQGIDLGWQYSGKLWGRQMSWSLNAFDRPGSINTLGQRDQGGALYFSMNLGDQTRRIGGGLGSRTSRSGGQEQHAYVDYQQQLDWRGIETIGMGLNTDSYGVGATVNSRFHNDIISGDAYAQSSSYNSGITGGINLDSMLAVGQQGELSISGQSQNYDAGMIVDVMADSPDIILLAEDEHGGSVSLKPGRNLVPVTAYRNGSVQLALEDYDDTPSVIQPSVLHYHLNKGGVSYQQIRVMKTVTVIGRLVNQQGLPLKGALIANHAGRSLSEADGFFAVEMSERHPSLQVEYQGIQECNLELDLHRVKREQNLLLLGNITCNAQAWAQQTLTESLAK
ncbi:fimbrial biogenesis outer membrane usher protein [Shewanella baltica]|uniref:CS1-pili formation C-terminal domain-containing protein n=1 Tax=Shewanella baltica TaxID=62322 RepID=UPI00217EF9AE|nr:CS1-pili formation C-terminal domain-containing protein [Shewanella baltica]MCS6114357.1 fimbrial biogenesis outer membrane usher protein [Shewanella baltica]UVW65779.1 fimbrial biogenesis outer membrane usher protein [Shewanella baltica]